MNSTSLAAFFCGFRPPLERTRFARQGVPFIWLLDPLTKTLETFRLESGKWLLLEVYSENDKVKAEPFQEVEIDLANLWLEEPS